MSNRFFIGAGTWKYLLEPQLDLPGLEAALNRVTALFTGKLGYTQVLQHLAANTPSYTLRSQLDRWFAGRGYQETDWIVLYYTGHGKVDDNGELYLLTSDYENNLTPSTSLAAREIGAMVVSRNAGGESRRAQRFLLILDTCFSGAGIFPFAESVRLRFSTSGTGPAFYVMASARPAEEADVGAMVNALIDALEEKSLAGHHQPYIFPDELVPAINRRLVSHKVQRLVLDSPGEPPCFFPNPRFVDDAPLGATVSEIHRFMERNEYLAHWNPVSRGLEFATQTGDFFTGRTAVMSDISGWLNDSRDRRICVVTGAPGSGKSAILSRILTTGDPPFDFDLAIHARGKTLDEFVGRIAGFLKTEASAEAIIQALTEKGKVLRLVVDALDEAQEPTEVVAGIVRPLRARAQAKILVGSRQELLAALGPDTLPLFVDTAKYLGRDDLARYVEARIGKPSARPLAQAVAEKAYPNFLIARLVSEDLATRDPLPEVRDLRLPESVNQAFVQYLERFGDRRKMVTDLLAALAWAEGGGLPWGGFWAPIASAMADDASAYTEADIDWLMKHAGSFVVEALEEGRSVYRLYHQAMADYLHAGRPPVETQQRIVTALLAAVPVGEEGRDWQGAHPYIRRHLAEHAAVAGRLPELLADPGFLLAADCTRVLGAMNASTAALPVELVQTYKAASFHLRSKPPAEAAPYLELAARQNGLDWKMDGGAWTTLWANWSAPPAHTVMAVAESEVTALEIGVWTAGQTVAVVGRDDGSAEVWDISTNSPLASWKHPGSVTHIALVQTAAGPLVVVARDKSRLWVHDLSGAHTASVETAGGKDDSITALAVSCFNDEWICATAHYNARLSLWNLPSLTLRKEREEAEHGTAYAAAFVDYCGRQVLLTGGDSLRRYVDRPDSSVLRLWSVENLALLWEDKRALDRGYVWKIEFVKISGRNLAIVSGIHRGEIWDLDTGQLLYDRPETSGHWFLYSHAGQTLLLAEWLGKMEVYRWELQTEPLRLTLHSTDQAIRVEGEILSNIGMWRGRDVILSARNTGVKVWDVGEMLGGTAAPPELQTLHCLESIPGRAVCIGVGDEVIFRNPETGERLANLTLPKAGVHDDLPTAMVYCEQFDSLIVGTHRGRILRLDASHPTSFSEVVDTQGRVGRLRLTVWQGRTVVLATYSVKHAWRTGIWDLETGEQRLADRRFGLSGGQEDKPLYGLAVSKLRQSVRFAFGGQYGKIMVADLGTGESLFPFEEWNLPFADRGSGYTYWLESGREGGRELLVGGTEHGHIALWNVETGKVLGKKIGAHRGSIQFLRMREGAHGTFILSGGNDGFVRVWNTLFEKLLEVELSEAIQAGAWLDDRRIAVGTSRGVVGIEVRDRLRAG